MVMAKKTIAVCDICEALEATGVAIIIDGRKRTLDLCESHITEVRRLWSLGEGRDAKTGVDFNDIKGRFQRNT